MRKKLLKGFIVAFISLFVLTGIVSAQIGNPDYVAIGDIYVFRDVLEDGDQLYFVRYDVSYGEVPDEDASETWLMTLNDSDGTFIDQIPLNYYQHNIISIYLELDEAITWGGAHVVRIMGNPSVFSELVEGTNMVTRTLSTGYYHEGSELGELMIAQAKILDDDWGGDITLLSSGDKLNTTGSSYFRRAIPQLNNMAPEIFQLVTYFPTVERTPWSTEYAETLRGHEGAKLETALGNFGSYFGVGVNWMSFCFVCFLYLLLASVIYAATRSASFSIICSYPVIVACAWLGIGSETLTTTLVALLVIAFIFGIYFILERFA